MSTSAFDKVEHAFHEALSARERDETIDLHALCRGDAQLFAEVEALLRHFDEANADVNTASGTPRDAGFLNPAELHGSRTTPIAALGGSMLEEWGASAMGQRVGEFTLIEQIGAGAMGVVFVAEQENPRRTVALKLIRRSVATAALIRRFEREAHLLGRLNHSGIAQVYAAGVADIAVDSGRPVRTPYLAMELVNGPTIQEFVRQRQDEASLALELMTQVCDAVQHAHQRGVIHRDLKPANILVTTTEGSQPRVKVLDFGIARETESELDPKLSLNETQLTLHGHLVGTPAYMSPEQMRSERDVDARSDVYALGVIMHQLLGGDVPIDVRNCPIHEAARRIVEDPPQPLGSLKRAFRGDVETIVLRALQKDPSRRYLSPADLARDIRHYLNREPIEARRDSLIYVLTRQTARYRTFAYGATFLVVVVAAAAIYARLAAKAAVAAHAAAAVAQQRSEEAASRLAAELSASRIDQGRLLGATGDLTSAERVLWDERFDHPNEWAPLWALRQLYSRSACLRTVAAQRGECRALSLAPDGRSFATGGDEPVVRIWSLPKVERLAEIDTSLKSVRAISFSPDGSRLVAAGEGGALILELSTGATRTLVEGGATAQGGHMARNGFAVAVGTDDGWIRVFDPVRGNELAAIAPESGGARPASVRAVRFDRGCANLAAAYEDGTVRIWRATLSRGSAVLAPGPRVAGRPGTTGYSVDFSPDGTLVASGSSDRTLTLWRVNDGSAATIWETNNGSARSAAFSPDGRRVAVPGFWRTKLFDTATGHSATPSNLPALGDGGAYAAAFTPDGQLLITTGGDGTARVWDLNANPTTTLPLPPSPVRDLAMTRSGDKCWLASVQTDGKVTLHVRQRDESWKELIPINAGARAQTIAVTADASYCVVGRADGHVVTLDARDGRIVQDLAAHLEGTNVVRLTPDGKTLVTGGSDDVTRLWRRRADGAGWETGSVLQCGGDVISAAIRPDGNALVTTARPGNIQFWELPNGTSSGHIALSQMPWRLAFSPDGRRIAAGSWDRSVRVWDVSSPTPDLPGRLSDVLLGHSQLVLNQAFDESGNLLASVSNDGSLRIWDLSTPAAGKDDSQRADRRRCLVTLEAGAGDSLAVAFVPRAVSTNRTLEVAVGYIDGTIRIWNLEYFDRHLHGQSEFQRGLRSASSTHPAR